MGSPLKVVGVIDTDVSTSVAGRIGPKPDMLPLSVRVKTGRYADSRTYQVQMVREPMLLPSLVMAVLTNAIDTEGNLPEELTAQLERDHPAQGHEPITLTDTFSGPRYTGPMGAAALFSPLASIVNILVRNPMAPVRIESIDCDVQIEPGRKVAQIESVRLLSDTVEPGQDLKAFVTLKPHKGERETVEMMMPIPADFPRAPTRSSSATGGQHPPPVPQRAAAARAARPGGVHEDDPDPDRAQADRGLPPRPLARPGPGRQGQALPNLPGSVRAVFASKREPGPADPVRPDQRRPDLLGRRGHADAAVHGGQGCRAVVIVEVMGRCPSSTRDEDDMEHRVRTERCAGVGLARWLGIWVMMASLAGAVSAWAKVETWRQEGPRRSPSPTARRGGLRPGRVRLGQALLRRAAGRRAGLGSGPRQ